MEYAISKHSTGKTNDRTEYFNGIKTWAEVIEFLTNKLDPWTTKVYIYKYSSNQRLLGEKCVTMGNLVEVANSKNDKILI